MEMFVLFFSCISLLYSVAHLGNVAKADYTRTPDGEAFNAVFHAVIGAVGLCLYYI